MEKVHNPTDLRGLEEQRAEQGKLVKQENQSELNDVKAIMSTPYGRRFMWTLLAKAGVYRTSFTGNSTTFFNEGQRNIGLIVQGQILEACPELFVVMLNEGNQKQEEKA